jgi:hypothetical protein
MDRSQSFIVGWSLPLKRGFEHEHEHDNEHDFKRSRTFEEAA